MFGLVKCSFLIEKAIYFMYSTPNYIGISLKLVFGFVSLVIVRFY